VDVVWLWSAVVCRVVVGWMWCEWNWAKGGLYMPPYISTVESPILISESTLQ